MERIVLGSGKLYVDEFTGELPEDAAIEVEAKLLGYIQGGATLTYKPTFYEAKDDLNFVSKKIITDEEAILKSGVMTWNGEKADTHSQSDRGYSQKDQNGQNRRSEP